MSHTHKIQIAFYSLVIKHVLVSEAKHFPALKGMSVDTTGGVWLRGQPAETTFEVGPAEAFVGTFLRQKLCQDIMWAELDQVRWGLNSSCTGCDFVDGCEKRAASKHCVTQIPGTSRQFKNFADDLHQRTKPVTLWDIEDSARLKAQPELPATTAGDIYAAFDDWKVRCKALSSNEMLLLGRASSSLPTDEGVAVVLSIHIDEELDRVFGFSIASYRGVTSALANIGDPVVHVISSPGEASDGSARNPVHRSDEAHQLVEKLHAVLRGHQDVLASSGDRSLHVYVFEPKERDSLSRILIGAVLDLESDPGYADRAHALYVTLFADELCLQSSEDSAVMQTSMPRAVVFSVLVTELNRLFAFPIKRKLDFDTSFTLLAQPSIEDKEWYADECFNCCSTSWITFMWLNESETTVIKDLSKARCYMIARMVRGLRKRRWKQGALDIDPDSPLHRDARTLKRRGYVDLHAPRQHLRR